MSVIRFTELFIQDALSKHERLLQMLGNAGLSQWGVQPSDVVNQEYAIGSGRIDVLATFNRRERIVIVESKLGTADKPALDQLLWYMREIKKVPDFQNLKNEHIAGFLVAEDFCGIKATDLDIAEKPFLFKFQQLQPGTFPFELIPPEKISQSQKPDSEDAVSRTVSRQSSLVSFDEHVDWIGGVRSRLSEEGKVVLRKAFQDAAHCFMPEEDTNRSWVIINPKKDFVGVHYKGQYIIDLWVKRSCFDIGWNNKNGIHIAERVTDTNWQEVISRIKSEIEEVRAKINEEIEPHIRAYQW